AADLELERLMADRWPIVLETFGIVAALEDLAERVEAGGSPPISIDVERAEGRPPAEVEQAAWRFAQVTLDNAMRHAVAREIRVVVSVDPGRVHLVVGDDGRGFDPGVVARPAARGLADATARAAAIGGRVTVAPAPAGGTAARFDWPARSA
ncbi:MAG TPA: ATP-binding protein, partial [Candidatus Limnocylindrales bacterium]